MISNLRLHIRHLVVSFVIFTLHCNGSAQNWEPVHFSETMTFVESETDSLTHIFLYPYAMTDDTITGRFLPVLANDVPCEQTAGCISGSNCKVALLPFLGEFAVYMPNGILELRHTDTLRIFYKAEPGDYWVFNESESSDPEMAMITDKYEGVILGQTDSIKVITTTGGITIHLSKQYGLVLWSDMAHTYSLESIPSINLGGSALTYDKIFAFSPGDVFVYLKERTTGLAWGSGQDFYMNLKHVMRFEVLNVIDNPDNRIIDFELTAYGSTEFNSFWGGSNYSVGSYTDSVVTTISLSSDCDILDWPQRAPVAENNPEVPFDNVIHNMYFTVFEPYMDCCCMNTSSTDDCKSENELLLGIAENELYNYINLVPEEYGGYQCLGTSMTFNSNPIPPPPLSILGAMNYEIENLHHIRPNYRCAYTGGTNTPHIQSGEQFSDYSNQFLMQGNFFIVGEELGIVAYRSFYFGLGEWCATRLAMIGFQKFGSEPFGLVPTPLELLILSTNSAHSTGAIQLYPNPATTTFTLHLPGHTLTHATLHDMQGREVLSVALSPGEPVVDVRHLPKGMYIVRATEMGGGVYVSKLVVE